MYQTLNPYIGEDIKILNQSKSKTYPYLFNGIIDNKQPYGYEISLPKQRYLDKERIDSMRLNPLQKDY